MSGQSQMLVFFTVIEEILYSKEENNTFETSSQRTWVKSATSIPCPVSMLKLLWLNKRQN